MFGIPIALVLFVSLPFVVAVSVRMSLEAWEYVGRLALAMVDVVSGALVLLAWPETTLLSDGLLVEDDVIGVRLAVVEPGTIDDEAAVFGVVVVVVVELEPDDLTISLKDILNCPGWLVATEEAFVVLLTVVFEAFVELAFVVEVDGLVLFIIEAHDCVVVVVTAFVAEPFVLIAFD